MRELFLKRAALQLLVVIITQSVGLMLSAADSAYDLGKFAPPAHGREMVSTTLPDELAAFRTRDIPSLLLGLVVTRIAISDALGDGVAAQLTEFLWKPAFPTQLPSILGHVFSFAYQSSALLTVDSVVEPLIPPLIVMTDAKSFSEMGFTADGTESFWSHSGMVFNMLRMIRKQLKVFGPVVLNVSVDMVNFFWRNDQSPQRFFHDHDMLINISFPIRPWMFGFMDHHITTRVDIPFSFRSHIQNILDFGTESTEYFIGGVRRGC